MAMNPLAASVLLLSCSWTACASTSASGEVGVIPVRPPEGACLPDVDALDEGLGSEVIAYVWLAEDLDGGPRNTVVAFASETNLDGWVTVFDGRDSNCAVESRRFHSPNGLAQVKAVVDDLPDDSPPLSVKGATKWGCHLAYVAADGAIRHRMVFDLESGQAESRLHESCVALFDLAAEGRAADAIRAGSMAGRR